MALPVTPEAGLEQHLLHFLSGDPEVVLTAGPVWEGEVLVASFRLRLRKQAPDSETHLTGDSLAQEISSPDRFLDMEMHLPKNYPLGRSRLICPDRRNSAHCLEEGTVCLVPPFCPDPVDQLREDWKCLMNWVQRFVIDEEPELRYAYPTLPRMPFYLVFSEGQREKELKKGAHGKFQYGKMQNLDLLNIALPTALAGEIAGHPPQWSSEYQKFPQFEGFWFYLGREPRNLDGELISTFKEFNEILPVGIRKMIKRRTDEMTRNPGLLLNGLAGLFPGNFPILVGYPIEEGERIEVHWEMVLYPNLAAKWEETSQMMAQQFNIPLEMLPKEPGLIWGTTLNAQYDRFFGRGRLCDALTQARVAVVGIGAIGGTLADLLVRGGCRSLALFDYDMIQPGNICRSVYPFFAINRSKTHYLRNHLIVTSPYVEVENREVLPVYHPDDPKFEELKASLEEFDIIFDCSANTRVAWMLDAADLSAQVMNLSVTDGAESFLMVTDPVGVLDVKEKILREMGVAPQPEFYEGIGCWSPTFRASAADLNGLLANALARIDRELGAGLIPETFVLEKERGSL